MSEREVEVRGWQRLSQGYGCVVVEQRSRHKEEVSVDRNSVELCDILGTGLSCDTHTESNMRRAMNREKGGYVPVESSERRQPLSWKKKKSGNPSVVGWGMG